MRAIRSDACGIDVSGLAEWIRVDELNRGRLHYPAGGAGRGGAIGRVQTGHPNCAARAQDSVTCPVMGLW